MLALRWHGPMRIRSSDSTEPLEGWCDAGSNQGVPLSQGRPCMSRTRSRSCSPAGGAAAGQPPAPSPGVITRTRSRSHSPVPTGSGVRPARLREIVKNARVPVHAEAGPGATLRVCAASVSASMERNPIRYAKPGTSSRLQQHSRSMLHLRKSLSHSIVSHESDSTERAALFPRQSSEPLAMLQKNKPSAQGGARGGGLGTRGRLLRDGGLASPQDAGGVERREELISASACAAVDKSDRIKDSMLRKLQRARRVLDTSTQRSVRDASATSHEREPQDEAGREAGQASGGRKDAARLVTKDLDQCRARLSSLVLANSFVKTLSSKKESVSPEAPPGPTNAEHEQGEEEEEEEEGQGTEMSDWALNQILMQYHTDDNADFLDWNVVQVRSRVILSIKKQ